MQALLIYLLVIIIPESFTEPKGLKVGDKAPDFSIMDQNGEKVSLKETLMQGDVVLTFYRGAWCRYCMKQMMDYQDSLHMITDLGATLIAISPEHEAGIQKTVEKAGVTFSLIHDDELQIMLDYKVVSQEKVNEYLKLSKETDEDISRKYVPVPALYIINQEGIIEFVSFNPDYKKRMTVDQILKRLM